MSCLPPCTSSNCSLILLRSLRICQDIFLKLYENGWLEEHENQQLYCEKDQRFLADRYVEGTCPKCHYDVRVHQFSFLCVADNNR